MVQLQEFRVETWLDTYEHKAKHDISSSCCDPLTLNELLSLSGSSSNKKVISYETKLGYGDIPGLTKLRERIAEVYNHESNQLTAENVLVTHGAIGSNHLVFYGLVGKGDHVIVHYPTYPQLYAVPQSLGAEIDLWKAKSENKWIPEIDDLRSLIKENTKMIVINNPNNPTGAVLPKSLLGEIMEIAKSKNIIVFGDEVYSPLFHSKNQEENDSPSVLAFDYNMTISTGSMSKAYGLAGLRLGWLASKNPEIMETIYNARHYTTISVSGLDSEVAAFALGKETKAAIMSRNLNLARKNKEILKAFVEKNSSYCSWVEPNGSSVAFIRFEKDGKPIDSKDFCLRLINDIGILIVPGDCTFGEEFKGYVRIGFAGNSQVLQKTLSILQEWFGIGYQEISLDDQDA